MNKKNRKINFIIDGSIVSINTCVEIDYNKEFDIPIVSFSFKWSEYYIDTSPKLDYEYAIKKFQDMLPTHIKIVGCISCRHGNFCPFGDNENEIFCFKDKKFESKSDVCKEFANKGSWIDNTCRAKELLHYCEDFAPISEKDYYTYNDWHY